MSGALKDRLKEAREALGMSTSQMAVRVGLRDRKSWERYETGENSPKADALSRLVGLGVSAQWILTGSGPMMGPPINDVGPAGPVDEALLEDVIGAVEQVLAERRASMAPDKKARLLKELYMMVIEEGLEEEAKRGLVLRMARLAS